MNPLTIPLCALQLIVAALQMNAVEHRELTMQEAWTVVGKCAHVPESVIKEWFDQHPEWASYKGLRCDRECADRMRMGLSEQEIRSYGDIQ